MSGIKVFLIVGTTVVVAGVSIACNNVHRQRRSAAEGVVRLQAAWNRGACEEIFDNADGYFRRNQVRDNRLRQCAELRQQLGSWHSFQVKQTVTWPVGPVGIVWASGTADFDHGTHPFRADFNMKSSTARLWNMRLELEDRVVQIPGFSGRLVD